MEGCPGVNDIPVESKLARQGKRAPSAHCTNKQKGLMVTADMVAADMPFMSAFSSCAHGRNLKKSVKVMNSATWTLAYI